MACSVPQSTYLLASAFGPALPLAPQLLHPLPSTIHHGPLMGSQPGHAEELRWACLKSEILDEEGAGEAWNWEEEYRVRREANGTSKLGVL